MNRVTYVEPVFRPPSEAHSLILQVTNGCSWNQCTFCEMYTQPQKRFRFKQQQEIERELVAIAASGEPVRRIFLADGDAMTLSFRRLKTIMQAINRYFPGVQRVSSYCLPRNLKHKTVGKKYSEQHAVTSARLMNAAQPEYLATLVVSFPAGVERYQQGFNGEFEPLDQAGLFQEMLRLLETLELDKTIFRSDHASNYLVLKGVLSKDKPRLLATVRAALEQPGSVRLRQEWMRGL